MTKPKWKIVDQNRRSIHPTKNSKYSKKYIKGKIVKSQPGSFGLFCFKHKHQAVTFLNLFSDYENYKIIKVLPLIKGKTQNRVFLTKNLKRSYDQYFKMKNKIYSNCGVFLGGPPEGTICYDKIKVLE